MVRAASSAKMQCQIITGSEGFSLSDLGRVSVSPVLPDTDVHVLAWMSLTERQKFSWKLIPSSSCRRRFVSRTKELILEERTATNKPRRNRKEDIRKEGKEEREKETRRHSRIVLNAETRGWIALKPTRRSNFLVDVCKKGYLFHRRAHSQGRSQPRQGPLPIHTLGPREFPASIA